MAKLSVDFCGLTLDNPIVPASGTFGYGQEFAAFYDLDILGSFSFKGTTREPRYGNPLPRIAETPAGMLNAVGLQNPGLDAVIGEELPALAKIFHKPVVANISGFSVEEYVECAARLTREAQVGILEINISCPNVRHGGMAFGTTPEGAAAVTRAVKAVATRPVVMKLSPNVTDIVAIAEACAAAGADGFSLINTLLGMRIDLKTRRPVLSTGAGGLSGPAIFPVAVRMVAQVYRATGLPIMGMGGVADADGVLEMMMAGARAVQIGAENLRNPLVCKEIIEALPARMAALGIEDIEEIIGVAAL